jgi:structural maintenance of chromosome 1
VAGACSRIILSDSMTEAQRRASQNNLSLSEGSLEEYRRLFVRSFFLNCQISCVGILRKAQASVLAVEERQSLDRLTREEKTASRTFAQLRDRQEEFEQKRTSLREDNDVHEAKKSDVRMFVH